MPGRWEYYVVAVLGAAGMALSGGTGGGQVGHYRPPEAPVSAAEVIYYVDPKELFGMVVVVLMLWEFMKWFMVEAGKTMAIDWVLRKMFALCRQRSTLRRPSKKIRGQIG